MVKQFRLPSQLSIIHKEIKKIFWLISLKSTGKVIFWINKIKLFKTLEKAMSKLLINKELCSKSSIEVQIMMLFNIWAKIIKNQMKIFRMLELVFNLMIHKLSSSIISISITQVSEDNLASLQAVYLDNNLKLTTLLTHPAPNNHRQWFLSNIFSSNKLWETRNKKMDTNQHKCKKFKQAPPQYSKEAAALELNLIQPLNLRVNLPTQCKML